MYSLSNNEISLIENWVDEAEITFSHLRDDLIDHLCCDIENEINDGEEFQKAYEKVKEKTTLFGLKEIQEDTVLLINKRYRFMKNTMKIFGTISMATLAIGSLFKMFHWPGASYLIVLGFLLMCFVFFPATIWVLRKESKFKGRKSFAVITFLSFVILMIGILFKIQHWPGASMMLLTGLGMICFVFLPTLIYNHLQLVENKKDRRLYITGYLALIIYIIGFLFKIFHWPLASILIILGSIVLTSVFLPLYASRNYDKVKYVSEKIIFLMITFLFFNAFIFLVVIKFSDNLKVEYIKTLSELEKQTEIVQFNTNNLATEIAELDTSNQCKEIGEKTKELFNEIELLKKDLIQTVAKISPNEADDYMTNPRKLLTLSMSSLESQKLFHIDETKGRAHLLKNSLDNYKRFLAAQINENVDLMLIVDDLIDTKDQALDSKELLAWEIYYFNMIPMNIYNYLSLLQRNISIAESMILSEIEKDYRQENKIMAELNEIIKE
jgi:GldL N-terminal domain/GldM N-terminal domain